MIDRINLILQAKNITARQFAEEVGIQPSGMSHILSGRNNPSLDFVMKVINRYPEIDTDWLLFGKGEMYNTHENTHPQALFHESGINIAEDDKIAPEIDSEAPNLFSNLMEDMVEEKTVAISNENHIDLSNPTSEACKSITETMNKVEGTNDIIVEQKPSQTPIETKIEPMNTPVRDCMGKNKKLVKIVLFYDDHSFSEYVAE